MVNQILLGTNVFGVNATGVVVLKVVGYVDAARDRSVESQLSFHLIDASDVVIVTYIVNSVGHTPAVVQTRLTGAWSWAVAVTANVDSFKLTLQIVGNILHA